MRLLCLLVGDQIDKIAWNMFTWVLLACCILVPTASNSCTLLICRVVTVSLYDLTQLTKPLKFYGHLDIHQKPQDEYVRH